MLRYNYQINKSQQLTAGFSRLFNYITIINYRLAIQCEVAIELAFVVQLIIDLYNVPIITRWH